MGETKPIKTLKDINEDFEKFYDSLNLIDSDKKLIRSAYEYSKKAHIYQQRATGEPYISHPLEVAIMVSDLGMDSQSIIAALLHDVVEDTDKTVKDINEEFGPEISLIVDGLTKITDYGKNENKQIEGLRKILLASAKDIRILIIKLCDRLHNMRTIEHIPLEKRERISSETMLIYVPIAQKIGMYSLKWELEDLSFKYKNREMYDIINKKVGSLKREEREKIVLEVVEEVKSSLKDSGIKNYQIIGRPKNFYSIYKKIKDKAKEFEEIKDLYAVRIIVDKVSDCYAALGVMHDKFQAYPDKIKDYIANPKSNGYQSIHTIIYSRKIKMPIEVQIRTQDMHKLAEFGIAAHWRYKEIHEDKKFERKISWLREVMQWENEHKDSEEFLKLLKFNFFENEIFIFTPKNEVFVMPEKSTALDFAYTVHTDIGEKAYKAKINGFMSTIDKQLKSGDIVEIITQNSVKPSEKWLKFVQTNKARIKIRQSLNLKHSGKEKKLITEESFESLKDKITRLDEFKKSRKAKCCEFDYGDQIIGVKNKTGELVVHNGSCDNAKHTINPKILLSWKELPKKKEVTITLFYKDRIGILMDVLNIFYKYNINLIAVNSKLLKNDNTKMTLELLDGPYINSLQEELRALDSVTGVKLSTGLFW